VDLSRSAAQLIRVDYTLSTEAYSNLLQQMHSLTIIRGRPESMSHSRGSEKVRQLVSGWRRSKEYVTSHFAKKNS